MKIAILVEGQTERAFKPFLIEFLKQHLAGKMPSLDFVPQDGGLPTGDKLRRVVANLLSGGSHASDAVIALTDVYTGSVPPKFATAADAKQKLTAWAGNPANFYAHVALHDFEAWLIPFWTKIQKLAKSDRARPANNPESINHNHPPAYRLREIFRVGGCKKDYSKVIDTPRILRGEPLLTAISECSELKLFVNRIIGLSGGAMIL
jgi:hypothetical protein